MQEESPLFLIIRAMACKNLINITRQLFLMTVVLFFFIACKEENTEVNKLTQPESRTLSGKVVSKGDIADPVIIKATHPVVTTSKTGSKTVAHNNVTNASSPKKLSIVNSNIKTPGENGVNEPVVIPAGKRIVTAYPPARLEAKDAYIRDKNPDNFSSIGKLQGLRHDQIRAMAEDKTGNLWLGTDDGLTRYDGRYLYHYTTEQGLSNSLILSVLYDSKGNIWAGTFRGGAIKFDGQEFHIFSEENGLPNNVVNGIEEDSSGNIWLATGGGIVKYDGENFTVYTKDNGLCDNDTRYLMMDRYGKLWITTNLGGISRFDGESFTNYTIKEGLPQNEATALSEDRKGNIWIGLSNLGLLKYDGNDFYHYDNESGISDGTIRSIQEDYKGNLWIGTTRGGLFKFDGSHFTNYNINEGLGSDYVRCIHEDKSGNIWIGTRTAGLVRYKGDIFTHLTMDDGLSNSRVMSILRDSNNLLWLGTFGGYVTMIGNSGSDKKEEWFSLFGPDQGLKSTRVYSIFEQSKGRIWFGTDGGGIVLYDGKRTINYTKENGLADNTIRDVSKSSGGGMWIGTYGGGASLFENDNFSNFTIESGLSSNNILNIYEDRNRVVWFATDGGGLTSYNGKSFTHYTVKEGFFSNIVYSITEDKEGNLWFGTGGEGVVKYDGKVFTKLSTDEGLNNGYVLSLLLDTDGNIWAGTRYGINKIHKESPEASYTIKSYNYEDGFIGMGCNLSAIEELSGGEIIVGTNDRLTVFHGDKEVKKSAPFTMQMTNLLIYNEEIPWTLLNTLKDTTIVLNNGLPLKNISLTGISRWNNIPIDLELPHKLNYITFKFIAVTQNEINKVRYEYMLEGLDRKWNKTSTITEIPYVNLSPGNYTFRVRATSSEGVQSNEVEYNFRIKPPWWQTVWFYVLLASLFLVLLYLLIKYRERVLKRDKEILEHKVQEQTEELLLKNNELEVLNIEKDKLFSIIAHDLRGPFGTFLGLTQIMSEDFSSFKESELKSFADNMHCTAKNLYNLLENLLHWSRMQRQAIPFNPTVIILKNSVFENLAWIMDTAKRKGIELLVDIPEDLKFEADESMLQTVIRNIVNNAVKFTPKNGKVVINAKSSGDFAEISVTDNGVGMDEKLKENIFKIGNKSGRSGTEGEPSTGLGLIICKELVEIHKGTIIVESTPHVGSEFIIKLPLKQD